jgi:glucose/arabinose dehydrogenase
MLSLQAVVRPCLSLFIGGFLLAMGFSQPALAATSCSTASCSAVCTPDAPVQISTLVPASEFPNGADTPIGFVDPDDGRNRRFIPTQEGAILVWDGATQTILPTFFLDLRSGEGGPVNSGSTERGLLAMAVDPDYASNGRFYVFYTRVDEGSGTSGDVVIERYERSAGNPDIANAGSASRILVIDHPASNHNGGFLAFGPDGFLYISTGDGGGSCDGNAGINGDGQSNDTLDGKMLRIDVRGIDPKGGLPDDCMAAGTSPDYTVPSSNPFFDNESACSEVWALGLRNPFRFSFDRMTGDLYIGDVGQRKWEEINLQAASTPAPVNFGWSCREGCETSDNDVSSCSTTGCPVDTGTSCEFPRAASGFWDPVLCHRNSPWLSIMGGYRYRGAFVPSLAGDYFYGDAYCGQVWKTTTLDPANPAAIASSCWASGFSGNYGFAEDRFGELYIIEGGAGRISCIHNGEGCWWTDNTSLFSDGFEPIETGFRYPHFGL